MTARGVRGKGLPGGPSGSPRGGTEGTLWRRRGPGGERRRDRRVPSDQRGTAPRPALPGLRRVPLPSRPRPASELSRGPGHDEAPQETELQGARAQTLRAKPEDRTFAARGVPSLQDPRHAASPPAAGVAVPVTAARTPPRSPPGGAVAPCTNTRGQRGRPRDRGDGGGVQGGRRVGARGSSRTSGELPRGRGPLLAEEPTTATAWPPAARPPRPAQLSPQLCRRAPGPSRARGRRDALHV